MRPLTGLVALGRPSRSPYGNPILGLAELGPVEHRDVARAPERSLAAPGLSGTVTVSRICEGVQTDPDRLRRLHAAGVTTPVPPWW